MRGAESGITDYQFKAFLLMVCAMFDGCKTAEDYAEKVKALEAIAHGEAPEGGRERNRVTFL
ncbi:MAG: hypothetical protein LBI44_01265 [Oscillospiraceae bacterium]|jgi:hypothetical protein|nr:hypothetical protein [Oscillospiraceae bacterium]